jgi:hypothetical protein
MYIFILILIYLFFIAYIFTYKNEVNEDFVPFNIGTRPYGYYYPFLYSGCIEDTFGNINCISDPYLF